MLGFKEHAQVSLPQNIKCIKYTIAQLKYFLYFKINDEIALCFIY